MLKKTIKFILKKIGYEIRKINLKKYPYDIDKEHIKFKLPNVFNMQKTKTIYAAARFLVIQMLYATHVTLELVLLIFFCLRRNLHEKYL